LKSLGYGVYNEYGLMYRSAASGTKSLLEIQQEQARQLERERLKREENHQIAAKVILYFKRFI
jgi:hypothetical protein